MNKRAALLLIAILTLSSLLIGQAAPASAAISEPAVPEFTLAYNTHSSDKPATYVTDPYTGEQKVSTPAEHYEWQTIDITIKNQPFTSFKMTLDNNIVDALLYYDVQYKGHFEEKWHYYDPTYYVVQNDSGPYTVITFFVGAKGPNGGVGWGTRRISRLSSDRGGEVDFQVKAFVGYMQPGGLVKYPSLGPDVWIPGTFNGTESEWSSTQTIKIGESQASTPSSTTAPAETPTATSTFSTSAIVQLTFGGVFLVLTWAQIAIALIIAVAILLVIIAVLVHKTTTKKAPNAT